MSEKYRVLEHVTRLEDVKIGDLLHIALPNGNTVSGHVLCMIANSPDSLFFTVWFEDGRSYPVTKGPSWKGLCQFVEAWRNPTPREEAS